MMTVSDDDAGTVGAGSVRCQDKPGDGALVSDRLQLELMNRDVQA
jgi:hypothetical protein